MSRSYPSFKQGFLKFKSYKCQGHLKVKVISDSNPDKCQGTLLNHVLVLHRHFIENENLTMIKLEVT